MNTCGRSRTRSPGRRQHRRRSAAGVTIREKASAGRVEAALRAAGAGLRPRWRQVGRDAVRYDARMRGHECYHCKQWVDEGEAHDCWTTTERALTQDLSEDLREAWERLRETASELGEQRIYASHNSIMFARKTCYAFVRPKRTLPRAVHLPRPHGALAAHPPRHRVVEDQGRAHHPGPASRRGRGAADRLAARGLPSPGCARRHG